MAELLAEIKNQETVLGVILAPFGHKINENLPFFCPCQWHWKACLWASLEGRNVPSVGQLHWGYRNLRSGKRCMCPSWWERLYALCDLFEHYCFCAIHQSGPWGASRGQPAWRLPARAFIFSSFAKCPIRIRAFFLGFFSSSERTHASLLFFMFIFVSFFICFGLSFRVPGDEVHL